MLTTGSRQFVEQHLCVLQIGGVEALGEPAVNGRQQLARFGPPALFGLPVWRSTGLAARISSHATRTLSDVKPTFATLWD